MGMRGIWDTCVGLDAFVLVLLIFDAGDGVRMGLTHARLVRLALVIFIISMAGVAVSLPQAVKKDSSFPLGGQGRGPGKSAAPFLKCNHQLLHTNPDNDVGIGSY